MNANPIKIQVRDINHYNITNAKVKVIAPNGDILFNEKSQSGEIILDDIQKLKNINKFKVEIEHSHYKTHPKTLASCIRLSCKDRFHTLEFPYQTKLLVSSVYAEVKNSHNTNKLDSKENVQIYLKAHYNQDSIPNKDKQSKAQKQKYQEQKKETKWGYILFDKKTDIDSKLKEMTKDSTIPITTLKEFKRIYKEDSLAFYTNQTNTPHLQHNQTSIDSKNTNNTNKESKTNLTESKTYLLGEEIDIVFKEWQDKQIRFFAYIEGAKSDVSVDMELQEIHYTIIYDADKEDKLFSQKDLGIEWTDIAIETTSLTPIARVARIAINICKWGLKLLRSNANIPKKVKEYNSKRFVIKDNRIYIVKSMDEVILKDNKDLFIVKLDGSKLHTYDEFVATAKAAFQTPTDESMIWLNEPGNPWNCWIEYLNWLLDAGFNSFALIVENWSKALDREAQREKEREWLLDDFKYACDFWGHDIVECSLGNVEPKDFNIYLVG